MANPPVRGTLRTVTLYGATAPYNVPDHDVPWQGVGTLTEPYIL